MAYRRQLAQAYVQLRHNMDHATSRLTSRLVDLRQARSVTNTVDTLYILHGLRPSVWLLPVDQC